MRRSPSATNSDFLSGWTEIAAYLKCSPRNAQRWEKQDDLPIIRPDKSPKGSVFASKRALKAWMKRGIGSALLADNRLIVFDRRSKILWDHDFPEQLCKYTPDELAWRLRVIDLRGNNDLGVLLAVRFLDANIPEQVLYFSSEGKIEWMTEPRPSLQKAGGIDFENAWEVKHLVTIPETVGHSIYLAMINAAGWGGCILRVDSEGRPVLQFANAGFVERLCPILVPDDRLIIACGENNDFDCAFAALLGADDPPSCSIPGRRGTYRFANAPNELPRKYILFPRTELNAARNRLYGHAAHMRQFQDRVIIEVETGEDGSHFRYHFTGYLEPMYVFPSGNHECQHRLLENDGVIGHPWSRCPEMTKPLALQAWTRITGWQTLDISWRDLPWADDSVD